ncbi:MAG: hypothetical protein J3K34DRAFT_433034 [Monoraphidium minutum]|nr:MAG: hypothetical protein J3K34DRAFT_433034 [Monoraphidium minutum]
MMVEQDGMLDDIEAHVGRIKHVGLAMHGELEEQSLLLGEFESDADAAALRLRGARRKTRQLLDAAKADRQLQLIAALCAILAILVVTAFL